MSIDKQDMLELAELVATSVVAALKKEGIIGTQKAKVSDKSAYAKTEALLYNYMGFKRIIRDSEREINELRTHGVPNSCGSVGERVQSSRTQVGIMLPEESVESAVHRVEERVKGTVQAVNLIDKCMMTLSNDPYYNVLSMRYFEGRTLEDIGVYFNCDHTTISRNKNRLVKELAMRIFPNDVVREMM